MCFALIYRVLVFVNLLKKFKIFAVFYMFLPVLLLDFRSFLC